VRLLHIVPQRPPAIDGVGDFATGLAGHLDEIYGIESCFLSTQDLWERSSGALVSRIGDFECDQILLHFSGYGYDKRGVPNWLAQGLEAIGRTDIPVSVFFHELWASSPPWRTPFYFSFAQRSVIRRLHLLAMASFVSAPCMKRLLERYGRSAIVSPVPSNIPALGRRNVLRTGPLTAIVFGQEHTRERSVRAQRPLLRSLNSRGRLARLKLVGKDARADSADFKIAARAIPIDRIETICDKSAGEIAEELANSDLFLSFYPLDFLTKSGTIMAAFACGCPVVLPPQEGREQFIPNPPVILCDGSEDAVKRELDPRRLEATAANALNWYNDHADWNRLTERIAAALRWNPQPVRA
jgi:hypothetical protein